MKTALILAALIAAVALVAGCVEEPGIPAIPNQPGIDTNPQSGAPSLKIIYPANGDVIGLSAVGIRVNVANFRLKNIAANQANKPNEGHINYYLDGREQKSSLMTTSFASVPPGEHIVRVELRNNDDSPLSPPVVASIAITTTG